MDIAEDTKAIWFERAKPVRFTAGQFGDFTLNEPPYSDEKGNTRTFSFASAPQNDRIIIATRMCGSAFKHNLEKLPIGTAVHLMGAMVNFSLHKDPPTLPCFSRVRLGLCRCAASLSKRPVI